MGQYWTSNPGARPADMCDALLEAFAAEAEFSDVDVQPSERQWPSDDGDDGDGDGEDEDEDVRSRSYSTTPLVESPILLVPSTQPNEADTAVDDGGSSEQHVEGTPPPSPCSEHKGSEAATSSTKKTAEKRQQKSCPHCGESIPGKNFTRHKRRCLTAKQLGVKLGGRLS